MLSEGEKKLIGTIDRDRLVDFCSKLVKTPTVNPYSGDRDPSGELAGQQLVENALRDLGAQVERVPCRDDLFKRFKILAPKGRKNEDRPNIVGTLTLGDGNGPTVVIDAHIDTVAVDNYDGDPFSGEVSDGAIHGRGASDDKQGVSIMIEIARALAECGNTYNGNLVCCSVVDEECDGAGRGSLACIDHVGQMDAAIVLDGATGAIWNGCNGVLTAVVRVKGKAGHAASGESINAIEKAVDLFPAFRTFRKERGNEAGDFNIGVFRAGDHPANVPSTASVAMNIKTFMRDMEASKRAYGESSGRIVRELFETCVAARAADDPLLRANPPSVLWVKDVPAAVAGSECDALLTLAQEAYLAVHATAASVKPLSGWGDICHFLNAGVPAFGIGAGYPGDAHSASESVRIEDMLKTARTVAKVVHHVLEGALAKKDIT